MKQIKQRALLLIYTLLVSICSIYAQGNGLEGINKATTMVGSYFDPLVKLVMAVGAGLGLVGAIKVYYKLNSGDPDTGKNAASWLGAGIFLVVAPWILRSFFIGG